MSNSIWFVYSKLFFFLYLTVQLLILLLNVLAFKSIETNVLIMILLTMSSMVLCLTDNFIKKQQSLLLFFFKVVSYALTFTIISHHYDTVFFFLSQQRIDQVEIIIKLATVTVYYEMAVQYLDRFLRIKIDTILRQKTPYVILILIKIIMAIAAISIIIIWVFNIRIIPVVYTSSAVTGILIVVLTQMMKRSISNFFSGLFLILSNPFKIGDIISVNENTIGFVKDFNWRGVAITGFNGEVSQVPNETMLNSKITNHTQENESAETTSKASCIFYFDSNISPDYIKKIIMDSVSVVKPLTNIEYKPSISVSAPTLSRTQKNDSLEYSLKFFTKFKSGAAEKDRLTKVILSNLSCYGINQYKQSQLSSNLSISPVHDSTRYRKDEVLASIIINNLKLIFPILKNINEEEIKSISSNDEIIYYSRNDKILTENQKNEHLFLVLSGSIKITKENVGEIDRLSVSGIFGIFSSLTNQPTIYTSTAISDCAILKIDHENLHKIINQHSFIRDSLKFIIETRLGKEEKIQELSSKKSKELNKKNTTTQNIKKSLLTFFGEDE